MGESKRLQHESLNTQIAACESLRGVGIQSRKDILAEALRGHDLRFQKAEFPGPFKIMPRKLQVGVLRIRPGLNQVTLKQALVDSLKRNLWIRVLPSTRQQETQKQEQ